MVYTSEEDDLDRPRGILTPADRRYLVGDKSGYSYQNQYKRNTAIKERIINGLLDFAIIENHLGEQIREEIFQSFGANTIFDEDSEVYSSEMQYLSSLSDIIAFLYRETKEQSGFHPPFSMFLEHGIVQGEFEPGTTYYGNHQVDISFEQLPDKKVNVNSIIQRVKEDGTDTLNETEMKSLIEILARSDSINPTKLQEEFTEWEKEFEKENDRRPTSMAEIFSQVDHGDPHQYYLPSNNEDES